LQKSQEVGTAGKIKDLALPLNRVDADESFDQALEERISALAGVVYALEKSDIGWQSFLRNSTVRTQPASQ